MDFTASGGSLATKTVAGITGLGVSGGVTGEIGLGQSITISFDQAQYVNSLSLAQLYTAGNYSDGADEVAAITILGDFGSQTFTLTASEATSATWTGFGSVINLDPAVNNSGALWQLINPFGDLAISSIVLSAADSLAGAGSTNSDYGFHSMENHGHPDSRSGLAARLRPARPDRAAPPRRQLISASASRTPPPHREHPARRRFSYRSMNGIHTCAVYQSAERSVS